MRARPVSKNVFLSTLAIRVYALYTAYDTGIILVFCGVDAEQWVDRRNSHQYTSLLQLMWIMRYESRIKAALYLTMSSIRYGDSALRVSQSEYMEALRIIYGVIFVQNNFPMMEWHVQHMEKTVVKYVKGLSENASGWEKRNHKKYGGLTNVCRQIEYDIKHGVTSEQVVSVFHKVRNQSAFSELRKGNGCIERLNEVENHFTKPKTQNPRWF